MLWVALGSKLADSSENDTFKLWEHDSRHLVQEGPETVLGQFTATVAEQEVEHQAPFVGWVLMAVDIALTAAQLAETTAEVASSPCILECGHVPGKWGCKPNSRPGAKA